MINQNIIKKDCLKSFDGQISGAMKGWIISKIVFNNGGHQENVFIELISICEWIKNYHKNNEDMYVILIETNLYNKVKQLQTEYKDINNILITNHYDFQKYIMKNYNLVIK